MKLSNDKKPEVINKRKKTHTDSLVANNIRKTFFPSFFLWVAGAANYSWDIWDKTSMFYAMGFMLLWISWWLFGHLMGKYNKPTFANFIKNEIKRSKNHLLKIKERKNSENIKNEYMVVEWTKELKKISSYSKKNEHIGTYQILIKDIQDWIKKIKPDMDWDINKYFSDMANIDLLLDRINHLNNVIKDVENKYDNLLNKYILELHEVMTKKFETANNILNSQIGELELVLQELEK